MAQRFNLPAETMLDGNGDPLSGAKLQFYITGTTTPLDTFSDNALTSANANPVVADSAGRFGAIFLQATDYKAVLSTSADVVVVTMDPIHGTATAIALQEPFDTNSQQMQWSKGADVASDAALTLGTDGNSYDITGTTSITSIATLKIGTVVKLHFDSALTFTHHATNLVLPDGVDIITAAGDEMELVEYGTGTWRMTNFSPASPAGSWTPVLTFATPGDLTVVHSIQFGRYVRIGNIVFAAFSIVTTTFTHTTASGFLHITGLPFTVSNIANAGSSVGMGRVQGITKANYTQFGAEPVPGQAFGQIHVGGSAQSSDRVDAADMPTGGVVHLEGTFIFTVGLS